MPAWKKRAVSQVFHAVQRAVCFVCTNLDVAVDVAVAMEIAQRFQHCVNYGGDDRLFETLQAQQRVLGGCERLARRSG